MPVTQDGGSCQVSAGARAACCSGAHEPQLRGDQVTSDAFRLSVSPCRALPRDAQALPP